VGLACSWWTSGGWATSALINLNEDGTVTLITGAVDIGPGAKYTSLPQLVADELKLRPEDVIVSACDTDTSPYDHGDGGLRICARSSWSGRRARSVWPRISWSWFPEACAFWVMRRWH